MNIKEAQIESRECPNPSCMSEDVNAERELVKGSYIWFVRCNECVMDGPVMDNFEEAIAAWNDLPRLKEEGADDEDEKPIATLVRMLDETRTFHEELKEQYNDLDDRYQLRKKQQLAMAYGGVLLPADTKKPKTSADVVQEHVAQMAMQEVRDLSSISYMKDIKLVGKNVIPNLEKKITELHAVIKKSEQREKEDYKSQFEIRGKDLRRERDRNFKAEEKIKKHNDVLAAVDRFLMDVDLQLMKGGSDSSITSQISVFLSKFLRDPEWRTDVMTKFETPLDELIYLSSPFNLGGKMDVYEMCIEALIGDEDQKMNAYALAMDRFPPGTAGYWLAWNALGQPGKTQPMDRPRT